jgi:uncharacterized membrane protein
LTAQAAALKLRDSPLGAYRGRRRLGRIARIFLAGLLVLLPILVTVIVTVWVAQLVQSYAGPDSLIGRLIVLLGLNLVSSTTAAYFLGFLILLGCIFALGLIVESRLRPLVQGGVDWLMMRIPIISNVYDLSKRFVSLVDRGDQGDLKSMSPVWCFFGGEGGAAVLGLMPSPVPVVIGEHNYIAVLVPSAPVPFGGALIYVPAEWVKPAEGGVERLMNVYVSMGVTPPVSKPTLAKPLAARSALADARPAGAPEVKRVSPRKPKPPKPPSESDGA